MGKKWRLLVAVLASLSLLAAACGDDDDDTTAGTEDTGAATDEAVALPVQVDGKPDEANVGTSFLAYFPNALQARPGDTVEFTSVFTGEPHTVTFGKLLDDTFRMVEESGFDFEGDAPPPPELEAQFEKIPFFFGEPAPGGPPVPVINQGAAQPCFIEAGDPPIAEPCSDEQQEQPAFTGTQQFFNSGFVQDEQVFSVEIAEDAQPGDYAFMCLLHGPEMTGTLTIAEAGAEIPGPDEVEAEGQSALAEALAPLDSLIQQIRSATDASAAPAGGHSEDIQVPHSVNAFPEEVSIAAGESVTWVVDGPHTISFNAPEDARPILVVDADGTVSINEKAGGPAGWDGPPPPPEGEGPGGEGGEGGGPPPEGEEDEPIPVDAGSWDGSGFHSSSVLDFGLIHYTLTFETAGTYEYICLVHPDMEGTVKVG